MPGMLIENHPVALPPAPNAPDAAFAKALPPIPDTDAEAALTQAVLTAIANGQRLRIAGGDSKHFYGEPPEPSQALLDMRGHSGILSYEPSELVITARTGTPLAALEALLAQHGQCLPFEPPHFGASAESVATVGGMVASGLSGPARASAGAVRDYVLGCKFINGRGEVLTFGGQVMKNVAGYDVSRLMVGALGTLGVLLEVSLKVLPVPPGEATLRFACSQKDALQWLNTWGGQPLPLNASCWLEESVQTDGLASNAHLPTTTATGTLYLRLRGAIAAVEAACTSLIKSHSGQRLENTPAIAADWHALRDQHLPWFAERRADQDLWRLSVPQTTPVLDLPEPPLVEWHGGQRWVRAAAGAGPALRKTAAAAGGHATLFIAARAGDSGPVARFDALKPPLDRIHRQLKAEFDPAGIFNQGRLYPGF